MADTLGISIRRAGRDDAPALAEIGARTFTDTFGDLYDPADLAAFLRDKHAEPHYAQLLDDEQYAAWLVEDAIADDARRTIGYAVAGPCDLPAPDMPDKSGELCRLYLDKSAQGRGVGRRLLEEALQWLDAYFEPVYLSVYAHNYGAQRLYARYGFVKILDYQYMVGNQADPEWIMKRVRT